MGDLKSENAGKSPSLAATSVHTVEERLEEMMSQLAESLAQYGGRYCLNPLQIWISKLTPDGKTLPGHMQRWSTTQMHQKRRALMSYGFGLTNALVTSLNCIGTKSGTTSGC